MTDIDPRFQRKFEGNIRFTSALTFWKENILQDLHSTIVSDIDTTYRTYVVKEEVGWLRPSKTG